jgi:hypothetical protein
MHLTLLLGLYAICLAWMGYLAPGRDHTVLAQAMTLGVLSSPPLFRGDETREKTLALAVAVAYRESGFVADAVGDGGHSVCAMQIYDGPKSLLSDPAACVETGLRMLRQSIRVDPDNPVAFYARGPNYKSEEARRISRDRMVLAKKLLTLYTKEE